MYKTLLLLLISGLLFIGCSVNEHEVRPLVYGSSTQQERDYCEEKVEEKFNNNMNSCLIWARDNVKKPEKTFREKGGNILMWTLFLPITLMTEGIMALDSEEEEKK